MFHQFRKISVGGGDHPHIHADGFRTAQPLELALLEHAQQLGLQTERHVSDFIQENSPAMGLFEAPHAVVDRAREGALDVSE